KLINIPNVIMEGMRTTIKNIVNKLPDWVVPDSVLEWANAEVQAPKVQSVPQRLDVEPTQKRDAARNIIPVYKKENDSIEQIEEANKQKANTAIMNNVNTNVRNTSNNVFNTALSTRNSDRSMNSGIGTRLAPGY